MDWVKIMCALLDHRKIKMIRKGPEGNTLVLLWLLILIEGGKCNRGGYLMISDSLPYTAETLSMVTDIPLPTVQLGLTTFSGFDMIDQLDGVIFIKNWGKYQSEDKLKARRESDRARQERYRQEKRNQMSLPLKDDELSRDGHVRSSRDVTQENRKDKTRGENTTTEQIRSLFSGTPFVQINDHQLQCLAKRHGHELLLQASDIAAETWRRNQDEMHNPGGYLQSMCTSLIIPDWYVAYQTRLEAEKSVRDFKATKAIEEAKSKMQEEALETSKNELWESLPENQRDAFRAEACAGLPDGISLDFAVTAIAKLLAWESFHECHG